MISNKYITFENCSVTIMNFNTSGSNNSNTFNELGNNSNTFNELGNNSTITTSIVNNKETDNNIPSDSDNISNSSTTSFNPNNKRKNDNITEKTKETNQSNKKKKIIVNESNNDNYFVNHNCNHVLCNTRLMGWYSTLIQIPTKPCVHAKEKKGYDCYQATLICGSCTLSNNLLDAVWVCTLCASPQATAETQKKNVPFVSQEKYVTAHENSHHSMKGIQERCITTEHNTKQSNNSIQNNPTIQVLQQEVYDTILFLLLCCAYIGFPQSSQPLVDVQRILNRGTSQPVPPQGYPFGLPLQTTVPISRQRIAGVPISFNMETSQPAPPQGYQFGLDSAPPHGYKLSLDLQRMAIFNRSPPQGYQFGLNLQTTAAVSTISPSLNMETPQTALAQAYRLNLQTTAAVSTISPSLTMETPQTALAQPFQPDLTLQPPSNENDLIHDQKIEDATVVLQEEDNLFAYDDQEIEDLQDQNATVDQNGPLSHSLSCNSLLGNDLAVHDLDFDCFSSSANTPSRGTPVDDLILFDDLKDVPFSYWSFTQRFSPLTLGSTQTINALGYNS